MFLLLKVNIITKFLISIIKYIIEGGVYLIVDTITLFSQCVNDLIYVFWNLQGV